MRPNIPADTLTRMPDELTTTVELPSAAAPRCRHRCCGTAVRKPHNWLQLGRFGAVGASGYVVNLAVFAACVHLFGIDYQRRGGDRLRRLGAEQLLVNRHWTFGAKRGSPGAPGRPVLRRLAGRVRLQLRRAGVAGRRRRLEEGRRAGDRDRGRLRRCHSSGRSFGASGRRWRSRPDSSRALPRSALPRADCSRRSRGSRVRAARARRPPRVTTRHRRSRRPRRRTRPPRPVLVDRAEQAARGLPADRRQGAERSPRPTRRVKAELRRHPRARSRTSTRRARASGRSAGSRPSKHQTSWLQVYVDDHTGAVTQVWTGFQVAWTMARGYPGAFGRRVNACTSGSRCACCSSRRSSRWRRERACRCCTSTCWCCSASRSRWRSSTTPRSGSRCRSCTRSCSTCWCGCCCSASARGRPARAAATLVSPISWLAIGVVFLVGFRIGLNVTQLERDRRRLRRRDRRRQADPRPAAVRPLAERQRLRRHLRPGQLLRLRPVPADLRLERHLGRPAGRARGGDRVRSAHAARPVLCSGRRVRGPTLGGRARLRVGRVSRSRCSRSARTPTTRSCRAAARARAARDHARRRGEGWSARWPG